MVLQPKRYRTGFRLYCKFSKRHFGPHFPTLAALQAFLAWYDGEPRYVGTWLEPRDWPLLLRVWAAETGQKQNTDLATAASSAAARRRRGPEFLRRPIHLV